MAQLDFAFLVPYIPILFQGAIITVKIGVLSFGVALLVAVAVGTLRSFTLPWLIRLPLSIYVEAFRGTPLLIQLFFIYYGLPTFGILLEPMTAGVIGLSLNCGAYMSEVVRSAVLSVDKGQHEAAYALGYNSWQKYLQIIFPQALRTALPPFMNYFSTIIKETSLVSVLSIAEITRVGNQIYARTLSPFEIFLTIGCIYFCMTYGIVVLSKLLERRNARWSR